MDLHSMLAPACVVILAALGCEGGPSSTPSGTGPGRVTGTVGAVQTLEIPDDALIEVRLLDVSRADAPSVTLATQTVRPGTRGDPIPFELVYEPALIDERMSYTVAATVTVDGRVRWRTTQAHPVLTRGWPAAVDLYLERMP